MIIPPAQNLTREIQQVSAQIVERVQRIMIQYNAA